MAGGKQLIPRKAPRQRRSRVIYEAILEATAHLLVERGYDATTTNHIAERTGISIGSLYQYFPNKEAIAVELLQRHKVSAPAYMEPVFNRYLNSPRTSPAEMVKAFIEAVYNHNTDYPKLNKMLEEDVPHPEHIQQILRHNESFFAETIAKWIEQQNLPHVGNCTVAAKMVFFLVETFTHWHIFYKQGEIDREVFVDELTAMVTRYLFPSLTEKGYS